MTSPSNVYFIITEKPEYSSQIHAGHICYIAEYKYNARGSTSKLPFLSCTLHSPLDFLMNLSSLEQVSVEYAKLLLALPDDAERLWWFREGAALQAALSLVPGHEVMVLSGEDELRGVVRFKGSRREGTFSNPLTGTFFGVELQGVDRGQGDTSGSHRQQTLQCTEGWDVFVPFSRIRPVAPSLAAPPVGQALSLGDRVTYFTGDKHGHGMVLELLGDDGKGLVRISTDTDENGKMGGEVQVPLDCVMKGEVAADPLKMDVEEEENLHQALTINSVVEVTLAAGNSYGIIRWIGTLDHKETVMAGLELEDDLGVSDGTFKKKRFFHCPPRRALFVKLSSCRPDSRFQSGSANLNERMVIQEEPEVELGPGKVETVPPISTELVNQILIGRMKGIQGHYNSCYMDTALFSLFSCSSALDSMLFKSTAPQEASIQKTLLRDIVNPLRSKGFVEGRHIMKLRQQLQNRGHSRSFTTDEKDPEEFLMVIMHHILSLDPLLRLSAGGKVQESYCYQIFLDQNHSLLLPTVQQLLEHSFHSAGLKLAELPSCLILQMPRFGKQFKMFEKIIPSLELDVTDLLSEGPLQCILCGDMAEEQCSECFKDPVFGQTGFKVFCRTCSTQVHCHPQRSSHCPSALDIPNGYRGGVASPALSRDKLELFAVLCIETSHYVSFVKHGPDLQDWIFFDSMADREGETDGFNIPEVCSCPEVGAYLEMSPAELANQVPREMKGVAKRLFCDAYIYMYQSNSMCIYR